MGKDQLTPEYSHFLVDHSHPCTHSMRSVERAQDLVDAFRNHEAYNDNHKQQTTRKQQANTKEQTSSVPKQK
jgi:hypothetical protein